jgi:hypothetical protein
MRDPVAILLEQKADLLRQIADLGDFRPGSISTTTGRCGNPSCRCHRPNEPGHGPNFRLTYKVQGKTVTESVSTTAAREKAEREIERYRHWQQLSHDFVEVNVSLCRLRPIGEPQRTAQEKKRQKSFSRKLRGKSINSSS